MATFKRVDDQQVYSFTAYAGEELELFVGDVIDRNSSNGEINKVESAADAMAAKVEGHELYLLAQSTAVTEKTGTPHKTYALDKKVVVSTDATDPSILAGYRIDNIDNINW
jgi:hypothetical protein